MKDITKLEQIQRKGVRFICRDYKSRDTGCVTRMLEEQELPPLQRRRREARLTLLFKVVEGLVPAIPADDVLIPVRNKRKIKAKVFEDCETKNFVVNEQLNNDKCFVVPTTNSHSDIRKNSFFYKTIQEWNQLDNQTVFSSSLESFKTKLQDISI